jgi:hypothetical protein
MLALLEQQQRIREFDSVEKEDDKEIRHRRGQLAKVSFLP